MTSEWPSLMQADMLQDLHVEHVLVEFEGPQITLAKRGGDAWYFGVAADEVGDEIRWVYAPVSMLEIRGLASGNISTREVFLKDRVLVLDASPSGDLIRSWEIQGQLLPDFALPEEGVCLPSLTRGYLSQTFPVASTVARELALEQLEIPTVGISFKALSQALGVMQRLWNALAADETLSQRGRYGGGLQERAQLSFAQATLGSLRVEVRPADESVFDSTMQRFEGLVSESSASNSTGVGMQHWGARVLARYTELLRTLDRNGLQLLAASQSGTVFLSPGKAKQVLSKLELQAAEEINLEVGVGYFVTYSASDLKFEFYDEKQDRILKGDVDPSFREDCPSVTVGQADKYAIVVRVYRVPNAATQAVERIQLWTARASDEFTSLEDVNEL